MFASFGIIRFKMRLEIMEQAIFLSRAAPGDSREDIWILRFYCDIHECAKDRFRHRTDCGEAEVERVVADLPIGAADGMIHQLDRLRILRRRFPDVFVPQPAKGGLWIKRAGAKPAPKQFENIVRRW